MALKEERLTSIAGLKIYTLKEVEAITGFTRPTLLKYCNNGTLKAKKIGQGWKVTEDALKEFLGQ